MCEQKQRISSSLNTQGDDVVRCGRCLLPQGHFGVRLDKRGICNYCTHFDANGHVLKELQQREDLLRRRLELFRGKYPYDVMVGLSGGKDSTYVLYRLAKDFGLKVLAVTYDNGFLTDFARENIKQIVDNLKIDHFFYEPNWESHRILYRACMHKLGWPCYACFATGYFLAIKLTWEMNIPFFVHGRSPYQIFRNYCRGSSDPSMALMRLNVGEHSFEKLYRYYRLFNWRIRLGLPLLISKREDRMLVKEIFSPPRFRRDFAPELLGYFLFHPYDEENIKRFLEEKNIGYRRPENDGMLGHGDCRIHDAAALLFQTKHQMSMEAIELAVMLRWGAISMTQAQESIRASELIPGFLEDSVAYYCDRLAISRDEYNGCLEKMRKHTKLRLWGH